jgi:hypothetical protein
VIPPKEVGFPIRKSRDQRALASPPGLSQRATSFIASQRQGIHQMPFSCSTPLQTQRHKGPRRIGKNPAKTPMPPGAASIPMPKQASPAIAARPGSPSPLRSLAAVRAEPGRALRLDRLSRMISASHETGQRPAPSRHNQPTFHDVERSSGRHDADRPAGQRPTCHVPCSCPIGASHDRPPPAAPANGGPGPIRTADLTLIRGAL